jgi:hypothetical protein
MYVPYAVVFCVLHVRPTHVALLSLGNIGTMEAVFVTEEVTRHAICDFHHVRCFVYILVWIRIQIWIFGSMPLTYGSRSCYFFVIDIQDVSKKLIVFKVFCLLLFEGRYIYISFQR